MGKEGGGAVCVHVLTGHPQPNSDIHVPAAGHASLSLTTIIQIFAAVRAIGAPYVRED